MKKAPKTVGKTGYPHGIPAAVQRRLSAQGVEMTYMEVWRALTEENDPVACKMATDIMEERKKDKVKSRRQKRRAMKLMMNDGEECESA